jgi:hypothetical protein
VDDATEPAGNAVQGEDSGIAQLLHRIGDEAKALAKSELELARTELADNAKRPVIDAAGIMLGAVVGLIGLGFLCATLAVALEPLIPALWPRLLLVSGVYMASGTITVGVFMKRLRGDLLPAPARAKQQAERTAEELAAEVKHG